MDDLRNFLNKINLEKREFVPRMRYCKLGDFISMCFEDTDYFSDPINNTLTLYRCCKTNKIIGFKIEGISGAYEC